MKMKLNKSQWELLFATPADDQTVWMDDSKSPHISRYVHTRANAIHMETVTVEMRNGDVWRKRRFRDGKIDRNALYTFW